MIRHPKNQMNTTMNFSSSFAISVDELAAAEKVPAYVIFQDKTLQEMTAQLPQTVEAFGQISGVGPVKIQKYADVFFTYHSRLLPRTWINGRKSGPNAEKEYNHELFEGNKRNELAAAEKVPAYFQVHTQQSQSSYTK